MGRRQARYQVAIRLKHDMEVDSLVLNLTHPSGQTRTFQEDCFVLGPRSRIGWVNVSVPRLVGEWPESTDSPMAVPRDVLLPVVCAL